MKQLIHNGVIVPKYEPHGFRIGFKGKILNMDSIQEEMALAWAKKLVTEYVNDRVFAQNFFEDFCKKMGLEGCRSEDFDFNEIVRWVDLEKAKRLAMTSEERKRLVQERKTVREANKEKYGYAIVDGKKIELGNYTVEPASIFMGRGKHPLRGRWKEGAKQSDIILNLSPDAPTPLGNWKGRVWEPDCMWVARWDDPLRGREKYVWFSDSSFVKQKREIEKFNKAVDLSTHLKAIRAHINANLDSTDLLKRKIATVWYLIDALKFRVGDEKDEDEADTIGVTTLRSEHIRFGDNNVVFHFLGKDSVEWNITTQLPENVVRNLREFIGFNDSSIFYGVNSTNAKAFLEEVAQGFTPKVFRTFHATKAVTDTLSKSGVNARDPLYLKKYVATMANLEAAKACNHKRTLPKTWEQSLTHMEERLKTLRAKQETSTKPKQTTQQRERVHKLGIQIQMKKKTRDYNLNTSLKSYIDPRVYHDWGQKVEFDWKNHYSKTLQKKFGWVEGSKTH
ncbi:DNA topoisomerase I [Candidatus Bathyarchaeota archaeon]|nr:DNA topoisomerase I [Candidatus Bathyarchaeota archaeon]